jgi:sec-independent protein translocase protein TatB
VGNLTFSEILWILVIILIVFGPQRLPEMARKVGRFAAKARDAATALQRQITEEYGDTIAPLKDVRDDLRDVRRSLTDSARMAARDLEETTQIKDVAREMRSAKDEISRPTTSADSPVGDVPEPRDDEGSGNASPATGEETGP